MLTKETIFNDYMKPISSKIDAIFTLVKDLNAEGMRDYFQSRIYEQEIVYYTRAIAYLSQEDPSLRESLSLAREYGDDLRDLSSEVLATLHYQQALSETLGGIDFESMLEEMENVD